MSGAATPVRADALLDDPKRLATGDPGGMLEQVATAAAQVRDALDASRSGRLRPVAAWSRPRAVVVAGVGGSGIAGHVLQAAAGPSAHVPVERVRGWTLPAWVGPDDVVVCVSSSGRTAETLACAQEAVRRQARVVVVAADASPLAKLAADAGAPFVPVPTGRPPRANLWALSVPLLVLAETLGVADAPPDTLADVATLLNRLSASCAARVPVADNPAKQLATAMHLTLPLLWGTSDLAGVAAYRLLCQLAENAKTPSVNGVLPEALHNQVVTFDGSWADGAAPRPLHLVLLRDSVEHPTASAGANAAVALAAEKGLTTSAVDAVGMHPLERMASLVAVGDFASVYLGILDGVDPTPIGPIDTLKQRVADAGPEARA